MTATSRGAFLGWLSQYPDELEFLYAPLCALSIVDGPRINEGVIHFDMDFHNNPSICLARVPGAKNGKTPVGTRVRESQLFGIVPSAKEAIIQDDMIHLSGIKHVEVLHGSALDGIRTTYTDGYTSNCACRYRHNRRGRGSIWHVPEDNCIVAVTVSHGHRFSVGGDFITTIQFTCSGGSQSPLFGQLHAKAVTNRVLPSMPVQETFSGGMLVGIKSYHTRTRGLIVSTFNDLFTDIDDLPVFMGAISFVWLDYLYDPEPEPEPELASGPQLKLAQESGTSLKLLVEIPSVTVRLLTSRVLRSVFESRMTVCACHGALPVLIII